ncbi:alpha/beta fold hydrolase [Streptomyces hirsutus]|uniref:thioesterase II family protein n=1 Tax=Streptomyces hirsutus TaxID=35620 RepID=UPI00386F4FDE|nr:alpha/beta fold hydrolase [Streptomyces hirsutus]
MPLSPAAEGPRSRSDGPLRMMCVPHAGSGAGVYRPWQRNPPSPALQVVPIQLPGREEEFTAPCYRSVEEAAHGIAGRMAETAGSAPFLVFGHSLGAVLAYEATRLLLEGGGPAPLHLVVSGSVSPRRRRPQHLPADDRQAVEQLREMTGQPLDALDEPELRELLLPVLRADIGMLDRYRPAPGPPLPIPFTAIRGRADASVPAADWRDWEHYTSEAFRAVEMPGGHMYLTDSWPAVWRTVEALV